MKNPTKKQCRLFLESIAEVKPWDDGNGNKMDAYFSKVDGSYITFVGLEKDISWLVENGITEQIQSASTDGNVVQIGFNPKEQKWYGWSHRAFFGFEIGSEVKKGDCGYVPTNMEDFLLCVEEFWKDESHTNVSAIISTNEKGVVGAQVTWEYDPDHTPNKSLHGTIGESFMYPPKQWGRGEWKAKTLEDAKQMAIDFAKSVS
jgi:hypothetical protein